MSASDIAASVLILAGVPLAVLAGVGLQRFPDVFARMHSATKPATLGLLLVLVGTAFRLDDARDIARLLLVVLLQFATVAVGSHMVGRAAYRSGQELSGDTILDELAADDDPG